MEQTEARKEETAKKVKVVETKFKCRDCGEIFNKKETLKKHIDAVHPKQVKCEICEEIFDQNWKLEEHAKTHTNEKPHQCDICDKSFVLKWRLKKHKQGHEQVDVKFCHYFNNNKICKFEELSGCMFRHELAPICKKSKNCRIKKCQFSHDLNNVDNETDSDTETFDNEADPSDCETCKVAFPNEKVKHTIENLQECSVCDFNTKCWMEYNTHWSKTPNHCFSIDELREMGYNL